jgi:hypothetical protein
MLWLILAVGVVNAVLLVVLLVRAAKGGGGFDQILREEFRTGREEQRAAARALSEGFRAWARSGERPAGQPDALAPLAAVHAYPSRIRCATLPWTTLEAVLDGKGRASSE